MFELEAVQEETVLFRWYQVSEQVMKIKENMLCSPHLGYSFLTPLLLIEWPVLVSN